MLSERPSSDLTFRAPHSLVPGVSLSLLNNPLSIALFFFVAAPRLKKTHRIPPAAQRSRPHSPCPLQASPHLCIFNLPHPLSISDPASPLFLTRATVAQPRKLKDCIRHLLPLHPPAGINPAGSLPCHLPFSCLAHGSAPCPCIPQQCIEHIVSDPLDSSGPTLTC